MTPPPCGCAAKGRPRNLTQDARCHLCIYAEHDAAMPFVLGAVKCTVDGRSLEMASHPSCPKGYVSPDGDVRWLGVWWIGLPMPLRLVLRLHPARFRNRMAKPFPGCGCVRRLKRTWEKWRNRWARPRR